MTVLEVGTGFSGIGVPDLCARLLGMRTIWQIEKDEFCRKVLHKNFPEVESLYGDIFDVHYPPHVDIGVFGFPCQPFSGAGKQLGERDPRYLVPEMLRVIDECKPRVVLLENVPGFASLDDGKSFKRLLEALAEMGLDAEWGHIRASDVGAPHQRERWFLVAYASSERSRVGAATSDQCLRNQQRLTAEIKSGWVEFQSRFGANRSNVVNANSRKQLSPEQASAIRGQRAREDTGGRCASGMGNAIGSRLQEQCMSEPLSAQHAGIECASRRTGSETQSGLGRVIDGSAGWVDGFRPYPSRPGEQQYDFEPPRVTLENHNRAVRLKALGNSMAVDVLFEIMLSIKTALEAVDLAQQEAAS